MYRLFVITIILLGSLVSSAQQKFSKYVDPFIGTGSHGHTYPGASLPFGMVQLSPDTRNDNSWDSCSGYHYSDSTILGFSHTHLSGVGIPDYGDILLLPFRGKTILNPGSRDGRKKGYRSSYRHETEEAYPGYYSVYLDDYKVKTELTCTERVGFHRYHFEGSGTFSVLLDLIHRDPVMESSLKIVGENRIEGHRRSKLWAGDQQLFFVMEFSKPIKSYSVYNNKQKLKGQPSTEGTNLQSVANFDLKNAEVLEVKVAISAVSIDGARKNLEVEASGLDFDKALLKAKSTWEKCLQKISVKGGTEKQKRIFYTSLYHCLLTPNLYQDVDGKYRGIDGNIHTANGFTNYTVFSLWDTFRALHPLLTILEPARTNDFVRTLVEKSRQYGELPMWELAANDTRCMIGYHAVSLIADAYAKGIRNYNLEETYKEMKKTAMLDKRGLKAYRNTGFVPSNKSSQGVSKTLEYAYNDWCIAQIAKALNKKSDYEYFARRANFYHHSFDTSTRFMRGKSDEHQWVNPFDPQNVAYNYNYTEGNAYQYSLFVPHDLAGMTDLLGGKEELSNWLDRLFTTGMKHKLGEDTDVTGLIGQYAHGNEPSHHMAYLYNYAGKPWKTQEMVKQIMEDLYNDTPGGICGNEDCGQMSAWYVLSAMGFYSLCPGMDYYEIGAPVFDEVVINTDNGKTFTITANNANFNYVNSLQLNGENYSNPLLYHSSILEGGHLHFDMSNSANVDALIDYPEIEKGIDFVSMPYLSNPSDYFLDTYVAEIECDDPDVVVYFTLDGTEPTKASNKYTSPVEIKNNVVLKMRSYKGNSAQSNVVTRCVRKSESLVIDKEKLQCGLRYKFYQGVYRSVYDFEQDIPVDTGIIKTPELSRILRDEWIGADFYGYIDIPEDGEYLFYVKANDGCQLLINNEEIFESDGRKSKAFEQKAKIVLKKGLHRFQVKYFQCSDNIKLEVSWAGKDFKRQLVPDHIFYSHK